VSCQLSVVSDGNKIDTDMSNLAKLIVIFANTKKWKIQTTTILSYGSSANRFRRLRVAVMCGRKDLIGLRWNIIVAIYGSCSVLNNHNRSIRSYISGSCLLILILTYFDAGILLSLTTLFTETNTFVSGK
jgi:hypothetical protein